MSYRSLPTPQPPTRLAALLALAALALATAAWAEPQERRFSETLSLPADATLRVANLAGRMRLEPGSGPGVEIEATVWAEGRDAGETRRLLDAMKWIEGQDRKGRSGWYLSYPVDDYRGFHYPKRNEAEEDSVWWKIVKSLDNSRTTTYYRGSRVTLYSGRSRSVPTLFADLVVRVPARATLAVRNVVGDVEAETLDGDLEIDTGSGSVDLEAFTGTLVVDTGSGSVWIGSARGETDVDTGSGSIKIGQLIGNGNFDTGSGSIRVESVAAGRLVADTGSGSIDIAEGTVGQLKADTGSGSIRISNVEIETFVGDTGSGSVLLESSLASARDVRIDTGSGSVKILAGPDASFDLDADLGSGNLVCRYDDATLRKRGHKVVGARRGDGRTRIQVETGSGGCSIGPALR